MCEVGVAGATKRQLMVLGGGGACSAGLAEELAQGVEGEVAGFEEGDLHVLGVAEVPSSPAAARIDAGEHLASLGGAQLIEELLETLEGDDVDACAGSLVDMVGDELRHLAMLVSGCEGFQGRLAGGWVARMWRILAAMSDELVERFSKLRVWRNNGRRAPHKPLLALLTLARIQRGGPQFISWTELEPQLRDLLVEFGPRSKSIHPEYPFWYMRNDKGLWVVPEVDQLEVNNKGFVSVRELRERNPRGGFSDEVDTALRADPSLVNEVVAALLERNFTESWHEDILDRIGLPYVADAAYRRARSRDPKFRHEVLRIYEHRCAVCGFDARMGNAGIAVEAAHVRWHAFEGPDTLDNGLALCVLHHRALDRGALAIDEQRRVQVSSHLVGANVVEETLIRYHGRPLRAPQAGEPGVADEHAAWHRREVFCGPARKL